MDFEKDARTSIDVDENNLSRINQKVEELRSLDEAVAATEETLSELKRDRDHIKQIDIPSIMQESGIEMVKTSDGATLTVKHQLKASISKKRLDEAILWLKEQGLSDIVKHQVACDFKIEERELVEKLTRLLNDHGFKYTVKMSIHPSTISAVCRELREEGVDIPECISVFEYDEAKIK